MWGRSLHNDCRREFTVPGNPLRPAESPDLALAAWHCANASAGTRPPPPFVRVMHTGSCGERQRVNASRGFHAEHFASAFSDNNDGDHNGNDNKNDNDNTLKK